MSKCTNKYISCRTKPLIPGRRQKRKCIKCGRLFVSDHSGHRICGRHGKQVDFRLDGKYDPGHYRVMKGGILV